LGFPGQPLIAPATKETNAIASRGNALVFRRCWRSCRVGAVLITPENYRLSAVARLVW